MFDELVCTICPNSCRMNYTLNEKGEVVEVFGNKCKRGEVYIKTEVLNPVRMLTTIVRLNGGKTRMCPVRTSKPIPKELLMPMAKAIASLAINAPARIGDVVVKNIMGTGADLIVTRNLD